MIQNNDKNLNTKKNSYVIKFTRKYEYVIGGDKYKLFKFICANNEALKMIKE